MEPFELPGTAPVLYFNHNHNNSVSKKKLANKYTRNFHLVLRVGTIVDRKKVLKQAGVVHDIKSQKIN